MAKEKEGGRKILIPHHNPLKMYMLIKHKYIYGMKVKGKLPRVQRKLMVWIGKAETGEYGGNAQNTIYMKMFLGNTVPCTK